jgi:glutathione S-transferase
MMVLYSGTTCPFSHRCRFVLFEKGMDFEIRDVDLYNKPEDISVMNPYGQVPILVERDLILYESNIINEYIDERFPHPQLMPGDPVDRARVRLFLLNFEKELFVHVSTLENRTPRATRRRWKRPARTSATASRSWHPCSSRTSTCWATTSRCSTWPSRRCCGASTTTASTSARTRHRC